MNLERYHRQMLLPFVGESGQERLASSTAVVVGCGALGCTSASWLVRAGVGKVRLLDRDVVERTNLQRQLLFNEHDAAQRTPKALAARDALSAANSDVDIEAVVDDLDYRNAEELLSDADVIVDGLDNFETRFLLNDVAVKHGVGYVYGGAVATVGMMYPVLPATEGGGAGWESVAGVCGPCLRCIFGHSPTPGPDSGPTCDTAGVLGPGVGIVASFQAAEAIKILLSQWEQVSRTMLHMDFLSNTIRQLDVAKSVERDCVCCGDFEFEYLEGKHASRTTKLCGRNAVQLSRSGGQTPHGTIASSGVALEALAERLASVGATVRHNDLMVRAQLQDGERAYELTVFENGRAIVKGTEDPAEARSVYARFVGG